PRLQEGRAPHVPAESRPTRTPAFPPAKPTGDAPQSTGTDSAHGPSQAYARCRSFPRSRRSQRCGMRQILVKIVSDVVVGNFITGRIPQVIGPFDRLENLFKIAGKVGLPDKNRMQRDTHDTPAVLPLPPQPVELALARLCEILERHRNRVTVVQLVAVGD